MPAIIETRASACDILSTNVGKKGRDDGMHISVASKGSLVETTRRDHDIVRLARSEACVAWCVGIPRCCFALECAVLRSFVVQPVRAVGRKFVLAGYRHTHTQHWRFRFVLQNLHSSQHEARGSCCDAKIK
jgi:hypothetical protein